jgi:hypothetical protein
MGVGRVWERRRGGRGDGEVRHEVRRGEMRRGEAERARTRTPRRRTVKRVSQGWGWGWG